MEKPFDVESGVPFGDEQPSVAINVKLVDGAIRLPQAEDFIPNPSGKKISKNTRDERPAGKVYLENTEFRSHDDQRVIDKERNKRTLDLAKQFYAAKEEDIKHFEQAARIVNTASKEQKADPTPELAQAMIIYEKGRPLTKKIALDRARKEVDGQENVQELIM